MHPVNKQLSEYLLSAPSIDSTAFIAANASVIGKVSVGAQSSIWFNSVVRADINAISIGRRTNVQDHCVLHVADHNDLRIGDEVSCGHRSTLHACLIHSRVLVGMGAIVMDECDIGSETIIAAGALVTKGAKIPDGSLVMGAPARVVRSTTAEEQRSIFELAEKYAAVAQFYRDQVKPE
jgi:carbonic anhydrase/acetyltransferase-like protein (isoleucine patch superfamily)